MESESAHVVFIVIIFRVQKVMVVVRGFSTTSLRADHRPTRHRSTRTVSHSPSSRTGRRASKNLHLFRHSHFCMF